MAGKELPYFTIGDNYGGNQSWFLDPWMHIGGCGALTMCDFLIYMATNRGREECYPGDPEKITRKEYRRFGMSMKPYLRPRESGIKDLKTFVDGARIYMEDSEIEGISIDTLDGSESYETAEQTIRESIDNGMPVAMLMLKHRDRKFNFFEWHWFLINGYAYEPAAELSKETDEPAAFRIKVATYGKAHWLPLREFWDTGHREKGGLVLFREARSDL